MELLCCSGSTSICPVPLSFMAVAPKLHEMGFTPWHAAGVWLFGTCRAHTHMLFCISNSTSCCTPYPLASLCLWLFMPVLTDPVMLLLLRLINRKQKQMIKWAAFLCFSPVTQLTPDRQCVWVEKQLHIMQNAVGLLYLIKAQHHSVSLHRLKIPYWHTGAIYHTGGGEEISSLLQPQWRASSSQSGEVSHFTVSLLFHKKTLDCCTETQSPAIE